MGVMAILIPLLLVLGLAGALAEESVPVVPTAESVVGVWERWEHVLTSNHDYGIRVWMLMCV